ncbi:MAG: thiolase family protein [Chloroflexi bacterium]|nr:thiolase family protein [Chloroflexota bacterium]
MRPVDLRDRAAIAGIGETAYVRKGNEPLEALVFEAIEKACADAGVSPKDIDGVVQVSGSGSRGVTVDDFNRNYGPRDISYVSSAPAGGGACMNMAAGLAAQAINAGLCRRVLVWHGLTWGSQNQNPGDLHDASPNKHDFETPYGWFGQPAHLAMLARRHMHEYGTTEAQFGAVAVAHRKHAILHGNAVMTKPITLEDHLSSRYIAEPLHLLDCCVINDGAAAYLVTSAEEAKTLRQTPVYVMGFGYAAGRRTQYWAQDPNFLQTSAVDAAPRAYAMAGIGQKDADFFQTYDGFTFMVLQTIEDHGFCKKGEGGSFVENGRIEVGGELPVDTSGGMLSQAYLQGMNHICDSVRQLRGQAGKAQVKNAEIGVIGGQGGAMYCTLVLRK